LSPIFKSTSSPEKKPIGLVKYLLLSKLFNVEIYPLGGVFPKKIGWPTIVNKFSGITYFKKKPQQT